MALVTLVEARAFLNIQDTSAPQDAELAAVITAVTRVVEREVGPLVPRTVTSVVEVHDGRAVLPYGNIISITTVVSLHGGAVDPAALSFPYSILGYADETSLPRGTLTVTYQVGMTEVPANIKYGALEVLKLAWAAQVAKELPAFLLSYRASAWFEPDRVLPGFA